MAQDDYKTMRVPTDAWERAKEQKESAGRTWGEQIVRPDGDSTDDSTEAPEVVEATVDTDEIASEVAAKIDYAELASKVSEDVVGELR
jgi:hypothetical protein